MPWHKQRETEGLGKGQNAGKWWSGLSSDKQKGPGPLQPPPQGVLSCSPYTASPTNILGFSEGGGAGISEIAGETLSSLNVQNWGQQCGNIAIHNDGRQRGACAPRSYCLGVCSGRSALAGQRRTPLDGTWTKAWLHAKGDDSRQSGPSMGPVHITYHPKRVGATQAQANARARLRTLQPQRWPAAPTRRSKGSLDARMRRWV